MSQKNIKYIDGYRNTRFYRDVWNHDSFISTKSASEKHESFPDLEFYLKTKYNHPFHRIRMKKLVWMLKVSARIHDISNLF